MSHERVPAAKSETVSSIVPRNLSETALIALARRNHDRQSARNPLLNDHTPFEELEKSGFSGFIVIIPPNSETSAWRPHKTAVTRIDDDLATHDGMASVQDDGRIFIKFLVKDRSNGSLDMVWQFGDYTVNLLGLRGQCSMQFDVMAFEDEPQPVPAPRLELVYPVPEY